MVQGTQRVRHWVHLSGLQRGRPMVHQKEHDSASLKAIQRDGPLERPMDWGLVPETQLEHSNATTLVLECQ
jgi:hypothetical protein